MHGGSKAFFALQAQGAVHQVYQFFHYAEPKTRALVFSGRRTVKLGKGLKNRVHGLPVYAGTRVAHHQIDPALVVRVMVQRGTLHGYGALFGEFQRIADQVEEDLAYPGVITDQGGRQPLPHLQPQIDALLFGLAREQADHGAHGGGNIHGSEGKLHPAQFHAGKIQNIRQNAQERLAG